MRFAAGIFRVFNKDNHAMFCAEYHRLPVEKEKVDWMLQRIRQQIASNGGDNAIALVETSLCAYEKHFLGSRYNGFYLDRMLG